MSVLIVFINVYAPNFGPGRVLFLNELNLVLKECVPEDYLFLGGDFNCTANHTCDRNHPEPHAPSQKAMLSLISTHSLSDVWRKIHHNTRQYTWVHSRERILSLARLDRFYCFTQHFSSFKRCSICPVGFSDHSMVLCEVFIKNLKSKSAYWHFNTTLLLDAHFREVFIYFWRGFRERKGDFICSKQWWDHGKVQIKQLCQQYTLNVSRNMTKSIKDLEVDIVELQSSSQSTGNGGCIENLKSKKAVLADLLGARAQGALVRSRFQSAALMDSPSKYFFSLEQKNGQSRQMHSLQAEDGQTLTHTAAIRSRAVGFYVQLYSSEYQEDDAAFNAFCQDLPTVSEETNRELEGPLTEAELFAALQSVQGGKAPGIDGLPSEFYQAFWTELKGDLLGVFSESFEDLSLPQSCRRAVLTLLPKKGDLQQIRNWRPVSLLCSDYKLLSKALANRLRKVMEQLIHRTQTYCVPGRSIVDNVSLIRDILEASGSLGLDAGLVSLDQEKAFDRVEHRYLWKVLQRYGLSPGLIAKIKVLYENIESVLKINGGLCKPFNVQRGIRQGCAMSGMLYSLSIEPLLQNVRLFIDGLFLPDISTHFISSAYADDIVIFIKNQEDIERLSQTVETFGKLSAAKVNWEKSEALAVGRWAAGLPQLPGGLTWKRGGFRYLGIHLGDEQTEKKNWEGVIEKVEGKLAKWRWLLPCMSYRGRVLIINNLVASTLWHRLKCLEPPAGLLQKIQTVLLNFYWDKLHWVPQSVLYLPKEEGGQGLVHLGSRAAAFRLQFVQRYLSCHDDVVWRQVTGVILRRIAGLVLDKSLFLLNCDFYRVCNLPPFYHGVFKAWTLFKWDRLGPAASLFWLLEEPLVCGARLDIQGNRSPGLTQCLRSTGTVRLRQVVDVAGPGLHNTQAVASLLGLRSSRQTRNILNQWSNRLSAEEHEMLREYSSGVEVPDEGDPFPELSLSVDQSGLDKPMAISKSMLDIQLLPGKSLYRYCVVAVHKGKLSTNRDTVWKQRLQGRAPVWRLLYKPPLNKRTGDLQWRILQGALAVNVFLSKINPTVSETCPFCDQPETLVHCYLECHRLSVLFHVLKTVFLMCGEVWSEAGFIGGAGYDKKDSKKWCLLNYVVGQAKMAIYKTRKNQVEGEAGLGLREMFCVLVKARIKIDHRYHELMNTMKVFTDVWCFTTAVCSIHEGKLSFNTVF